MSHELKKALDVLSEKEKDPKRHTYKGIRELSLFRPEVSVVYYDLTTLYFESEISDELKCFGYSKDNKADKVQVVLGVVLDEEGMPLTYEIYPGNTFEGSTVVEMIKRLKEALWELGKVAAVDIETKKGEIRLLKSKKFYFETVKVRILVRFSLSVFYPPQEQALRWSRW